MAVNVVRFPKPAPKKEKPRNVRADGLRQVRLDMGVDPETGKRVRKSFYGKTLKEAEGKKQSFLREREEEAHKADAMIAQGIDPALAETTVAAWIDNWLATYGQRGGYSVQTTNRINCEKLAAAIGKMRLRDVRQIHVQRFATSCAHYSKSGVTKIKQTAHQVFRSARQNQAITRDPCEGVVWQHKGAGTHRYLDQWEIQHIALNWREHRAGLWAMLMLFAGLRRGEALALRWSDIDIEAGVIHIRAGVHFEVSKPVRGAPKTQAGFRDVPILPPLYEALRGLYGPQPSEYICVGADHKPITQSAWDRGFESYLNAMTNLLNGEAAIQPGRRTDKDESDRACFECRAHDFRHTFASLLYDAGVDIKTAQKLLGHTSPEITMKIYTHLSDAKSADSIDKMAAFTAQFATPILHPNQI